MLKVKYEYGNKKFELVPFNTGTEKDLLLMTSIVEPTLDSTLEICGQKPEIISELTDFEKIAMLYKYREISTGSDINLKFKCKKCEKPNENTVDITEIVHSSIPKNPIIIDQFKPVTEDNLSEFLTIDIDELDIDEYEELFQEVKDSVTKFDFSKPIICQTCGHVNKVNVGKEDFVIENMAEDTLMSLYQTYNDLTFFGGYNKQDVDSLYPFERMIVISLLNKTREELNK